MRRWILIASATSLLSAIALERGTRPPAIPAFESVRAARASSDFVVEDSEGHVLSRLRRDFRERRLDWTPLSSMSSSLREGLIFAEDRRFASHRGVDPRALVAALGARFTGARRGGSTITMQLVRAIGVVPGTKNFFGKIRQIRAAWMLERSWTKDQILEAYMNVAPFRGETVGFAAAAMRAFGQSPASLSDEQALILIALLRAPNAPSGQVAARACAMKPASCEMIQGFIRRLDEGPRAMEADLAPHLAVTLSKGTGGRVRTTIDRALQVKTFETLSSRLRSLRDQNVRDGAVLVVERATGRVLASVGSGGPFSRSPQVDGTRALRQAGSTLKPFLYALAFDRKILEVDSWLEDSPVDLAFPLGVYRPRNHDRVFHGWIRARTALASSLNVPAVKVLQLVGQDAFWEVLRASGLESLRPAEDYGPALALGVADLSLTELTRAYLTLANRGRPMDLTFLESEPRVASQKPVFSEGTIASVESILASKSDRTLGFGFDTIMSLPFRASVKTGTSKDMRDNWALGWTKDYVIGAWVGNFDGEPMWDVSGLSGAAPVWTEIATWLHEHRRSQGAEDIEAAESRSMGTRAPIDSSRPFIEYPPSGLMVAIDPEIPPGKQLIPLKAHAGNRKGLLWRIDGERVFAVDENSAWSPRRGTHRIDLVDGAVVRESVEVIVR